jgi:8-amino-7-oxononanoate synthase
MQWMADRLAEMRSHDLGRQLHVVAAGAEPWLEVEGRRLLNLSSNNYLGLASHPDVVAAAVRAAEDYGWGAGSSRLVAGTSPLHGELERRLARFKGAERALLFTSGYTANIGLIPSLVGPGDLILSDELNHASLIDGCRLSRAEIRTYPHRDVTMLAAALSEARGEEAARKRLVVTDTVFSMDGDLAPLAEIAELCVRHEAMLMVDEAHATGCIGPGGRGLVAELGVEGAVTASMSTLSKALGSVGAVVAGSGMLAEYLVGVARSFMFTTALPAPVVAASIAALDVLERDPGLVDRLRANGAMLREGLRDAGFDTLGSETHIVPVLVGESAAALRMADRLHDEGVFAVAIRPPTVPPGRARIRLSAMATHTVEDLTRAVETIARAGRELGIVSTAGAHR